MKKSGTKNKPMLITLAAVTLLAVLVAVSSWGNTVDWFENAIGTILTPVQGFASKSSDAIADFFRNLFNTTDADKENEKLKSDLALFEQIKLQLEELKMENDRLRALANYVEYLGDYDTCTARVIAKSSGIWFNTFTLNIGRNKGVDIDMTVVCSGGLVGRVTEVGSTWCKVTSIIDSSMTVPVMVQRTRDYCMARGILDTSVNDAYIELYYLSSDRADITPGDAIITSGIGDVYPKGLLVGMVTEVMTAQDGINAVIAPAVDFEHLEEVAVILGPEGQG